MRIADLGPLQVDLGSGLLPVEGRQAVLLTRLAMSVGQPVSVDALLSLLWGDGAQESRLDTLLWRLRNTVEPARTDRSPSVLVKTRSSVRLALPPESIDSVRFSQLVETVNAPGPESIDRETLTMVDEAASMWRGRPFEAIADQPDVVPAVSRLEELWFQLRVRRCEALVANGQASSALADLDLLLGESPYREALWAQKMRILVGLSRTEEALAAYRQISDLMREELGLDPGRDLTDLHSRILAGDVLAGSLLRRPMTTAAAPPAASAPETAPLPRTAFAQLPRRSRHLIGRHHDLQRVSALTTQQPVVTIVGPGGCGKTRLAVEVAAGLVNDFDGVWFIDLAPLTEPDAIDDVVVSTLGLGGPGGLDAAHALASFLRDRRALLVVDNCEQVLSGVVATLTRLLTSAPDTTVLATSREPLDLDDEVIWSLSPLPAIPALDPAEADQQRSPAAQLFIERAAAAAPTLDLHEHYDVIDRICQALDGLPLAIELAAARVRTFSLDEIADQVSADPTTLSRAGRPGTDHRRTLHDVLDWSFQLLDEPEQAMHQALSVLASPFSLTAAGAVTPQTADPADLIARLIHRSLVVVNPGAFGRPTTFTQLATVHAHARSTLATNPEEGAVRQRRDNWLRQLLDDRPRLGQPGEAGWMNAVRLDYATVRSGLQEALATSEDPSWLRLGAGLGYYWMLKTQLVEGRAWLRAALDTWGSQLTGTEAARTWMEHAWTLAISGRPDLAQPLVNRWAPELADPTDDQLIASAESLLGVAGAAWMAGDLQLLERLTTQSAPLVARSEDPHLVLLLDVNRCLLSQQHRSPTETADDAERIYARAYELGNRWAMWWMCSTGAIAEQQRRTSAGRHWAQRLYTVQLEYGSAPIPLEVFANFASMSGEYHLAARTYAAAQLEFARAGMRWPIMPITPELHAQTVDHLSPSELKQARQVAEQSDGDVILADLGPLMADSHKAA